MKVVSMIDAVEATVSVPAPLEDAPFMFSDGAVVLALTVSAAPLVSDSVPVHGLLIPFRNHFPLLNDSHAILPCDFV